MAATPTKTIQDDSTCQFHTTSRMIIRSVFDPLLPMTPEESERYESCMPLVTPVTSETLATYSEERCSENGYIKIMLFYYFFELTKRSGICTIRRTSFSELLAMPPLDVPGINEEVFAKLRGSFNLNWFGFQLQLDDIDLFPDIQRKVIRPILDLGGYLALGVEFVDKKRKRDITEKHIVLVVGEDERGIHIKNSWNSPIDIVRFIHTIVLDRRVPAKPIDLFFILPVEFGIYSFHPNNMNDLYRLLESSPTGGKKRKTKYGQRRKHHQSKTIRASRKGAKTYHNRSQSKH